MTAITFPRPFHEPSARLLRGPVPEPFEEFYRETLRFRSGGRLRSIELGRRYRDWAKVHAAPDLSARQIKRAMLNIGHRHFRSNVTYFGDVQIAAAAPNLVDNFPDPQPFTATKPHAEDRIDRIATELELLRRDVRAESAR